eukprot:COSAG01_NODE_8248_length_2857_cov_155.494924_3_plen_34_part_01
MALTFASTTNGIRLFIHKVQMLAFRLRKIHFRFT